VISEYKGAVFALKDVILELHKIFPAHLHFKWPILNTPETRGKLNDPSESLKNSNDL
jgi:hypothetical protein